MTHDQYLDHIRRELVRTAREVLDGTMHPIEGVRAMVGHCHEGELLAGKELVALRAIESETDHFPLGDLRARCAPDYLAQCDSELEVYLASAWPELKTACERILERVA